MPYHDSKGIGEPSGGLLISVAAGVQRSLYDVDGGSGNGVDPYCDSRFPGI